MIADETQFPVVTLTFGATPSDDDARAFISHNLRLLERKQRHCTVVDMRAIKVANPNQRRMVAEYIKNNLAALQTWRAGTVFVLSSSLTRGIMTAIMWIQRPPYPWTVTSTVEAGIAWCRERLADDVAPA